MKTISIFSMFHLPYSLIVIFSVFSCFDIVVTTKHSSNSPNRFKIPRDAIKSLIVNGIPAPSKRPFFAIVWLNEGKRLFCGATIVDFEYVLTAAHCVVTSQREYQTLSIVIEFFNIETGTNKTNIQSPRVINIIIKNVSVG